MKIIYNAVLFVTPENKTLEFNECRARSFTTAAYDGLGTITRAALAVPWEEYLKALTAWRESGNPRKSAWFKASVFHTTGLSDNYDSESWKPDSPYLVDEAPFANIAIFHIKRYDGTDENLV